MLVCPFQPTASPQYWQCAPVTLAGANHMQTCITWYSSPTFVLLTETYLQCNKWYCSWLSCAQCNMTICNIMCINRNVQHYMTSSTKPQVCNILGWRRGVEVSGVRQWTKLTHVGPGYNWDWWPSSSGYTISGCNQPTRSTQPCIPPGSLNRVPASAGVTARMSPLPGGR